VSPESGHSGHPAVANSFDCCLEMGNGVEKYIERGVRYYHKAASQSNPGGLYNFWDCLEQGIGIWQDSVRAAKYYRLAAELKDPQAENSFGLCAERGNWHSIESGTRRALL
jgi:TPR repeat protein